MSVRDVIVIGSGPAGMSAARHAFDAGLDAVLIDRHDALPDRPYADISFGWTLSRAGITLSPQLVEHRVERVRLVAPDGEEIQVGLPMLALRRDVLDQELTGPLRTASALQLGVWAEQVRRGPGGVEVTVLLPGGERQTWRARCAVIAAAVGSPLLAAAGIDPPASLAQAAATIQVEMNSLALPQDQSTIYLGQQAAPGGWCLVMPRGNGRATLRVTARTGQHPVQPYLDQLLRRPELKRALFAGLIEHSAAGYNAIALPSTCLGQGPVLVAGSAAGQGGLALALAGGRLAAEGVIRAVRHGKPETAARRYARQYWLAYGRLHLERSRGMRILLRLQDDEFNRLFAVAGRLDIPQFVAGGRLRSAHLLWELLGRDPASLAILLRALHREPPAFTPAPGAGSGLPAHLDRRFGRRPGRGVHQP